jgi:hypothetical protein
MKIPWSLNPGPGTCEAPTTQMDVHLAAEATPASPGRLTISGSGEVKVDRRVARRPACQWLRHWAGFLHRFFMVPDQDRDTRAQRWRYPGTTGQT